MRPGEQPTGIIKCLPKPWMEQSGGIEYIRSIKEDIDSGAALWHMSFPTLPRQEVLHLYVLFDGHIQFRVNIVEFRPSTGKHMKLSYGNEFLAKYWAVCSGPMVFPKPPFPMTGFRGYRYTGDLW